MAGLAISDYVIPLLVAVSSLPAFAAAAMLSRGRPPGAPLPPLSRLMATVGIAILAGAVGLLWAGDDPTRRLVVIVAMVVAVNGLGLVLLVRLGRNRDRRP